MSVSSWLVIKALVIAINMAALVIMSVSILAQSGRGGGLSDMFSGSAGAALGSSGATKNIVRIAAWSGAVWAVTVIALGASL